MEVFRLQGLRGACQERQRVTVEWFPKEIPQWHKDKIDQAGWKPCPADEECAHCGRPAQYPMSPCCADDIAGKKLLPVDAEAGETVYPYPTRRELFDRIAELEGTEEEAASVCTGCKNASVMLTTIDGDGRKLCATCWEKWRTEEEKE